MSSENITSYRTEINTIIKEGRTINILIGNGIIQKIRC